MTRIQTLSGNLQTADAPALAWRGWVPEAPRAALLFVHGLAEHSGRYQRTAGNFAERGFACYGFDLRGHGSSQGRRVHIKSFDDYLTDLHAALFLVRARHRALPCFLVGHSMGGLITIRAVLAKPGDVAGAVVSSPLLAPHPSAVPSRATRMAAGLLSKVAPGLLIPSGLDSSALSRDQAVVDAYVADPLVSSKVSARWFTATMGAAAQARAQAPALRTPMLLMQSGADRLVDPEATRRWAEAAPPQHLQFVWWDGFYHEMFNEPERQRVFDRVEEWLAEHILDGRSRLQA